MAAVAVLALVALPAGCGEEEESAAAKEAFHAKSQSRPGGDPLGTTVRLPGDQETPPIEVTVIRLLDPVQGAPGDRLRKGQRFFGVEFQIRNVGGLTYDDAPARGTELTLSDGSDAPLASLSGEECADGLSYGTTIRPGRARTMCQAFQARRDLEPRRFLFTEGSLTRTGEWRLR